MVSVVACDVKENGSTPLPCPLLAWCWLGQCGGLWPTTMWDNRSECGWIFISFTMFWHVFPSWETSHFPLVCLWVQSEDLESMGPSSCEWKVSRKFSIFPWLPRCFYYFLPSVCSRLYWQPSVPMRAEVLRWEDIIRGQQSLNSVLSAPVRGWEALWLPVTCVVWLTLSARSVVAGCLQTFISCLVFGGSPPALVSLLIINHWVMQLQCFLLLYRRIRLLQKDPATLTSWDSYLLWHPFSPGDCTQKHSRESSLSVCWWLWHGLDPAPPCTAGQWFSVMAWHV